MRKLFLNSLLIVFGIIAGLVLSEIVLTVSGEALLAWQGYENREFLKNNVSAKTSGKVFRILCVGDSSTYGKGVTINHSYPFQLAKLLPAQSFNLTAISTGGTNSSQLTNRYETFLKKNAYDLVILQTGINDVHMFGECNLDLYTHNNFWKFLADSKLFALFNILYQQEAVLPQEFDFRHSQDFGVGSRLFINKAYLRKIYRYNFNKILALSRKYNAELWVQDYHSSGWFNPEVILYETYKELGLKVIHQKEIFDYAKDIRVRGNDKWHPNCYGYFIIARLIYNNLIDAGIVAGEKYNLFSEIDSLKEYIRNKREGYEYIAASELPLNEAKLIETLKKAGVKLWEENNHINNFKIYGILNSKKER